MSNRSEQQRLLDDVLAEASLPDFRAALLGETLRLARRKRRWRQARQAGGALVVALLTALLVWQQQLEQMPAVHRVVHMLVQKSYQLVETRPLPAGTMVTTENFAGVKVVSTMPVVVQIATSSGGFHYINDEQLLELVGPTPVVLIRNGPNSEELVFANPEDQKRFFGN